jgi:hypothetical protein
MTKHTPGPWLNYGRVSTTGLLYSAVAAKTLIAKVYSESYGDQEQERANARLIAAAPDLLDALIELVGWQTTAPDSCVDQALNAIEKTLNGSAEVGPFGPAEGQK